MNTYTFSSNSFEAALVALVQAFQRENPGVDYSCTMHNGTKVSIKHGKPPKTSRKVDKRHAPPAPSAGTSTP